MQRIRLRVIFPTIRKERWQVRRRTPLISSRLTLTAVSRIESFSPSEKLRSPVTMLFVCVGKFEPPRSSENDYFSNSNCTFNFNPVDEDSRVLIWYEYFNVVDDDYIQCPSDNLTYTYSLSSSLSKSYSHPFIYCGYRNFPSPYLSIRSTDQFRVHFRSNDDTDAGLGFDGRYQFLNRSSSFFSSSCRSPFDPVVHVNETHEHSGSISSDGYRENVICEWSYVTARGLQFNIEINMLELEGSKTKDPPQGCQSSVVRIYSAERTDELCGQQEKIYYFLTNSNWFTIQFISLHRQTKEPLRGLQALWTIVQEKSDTNDPHGCALGNEYFNCQKSANSSASNSFCIHRSLLCDGHSHCQPLSNDDEDSTNCIRRITPSSRYSSTASLSSSFFQQHLILIVIVCVLCLIMLGVATMLIILLIRMKRKQSSSLSSAEFDEPPPHSEKRQRRRRQNQRDHLSSRKKSTQTYLNDDDDDDDEDGRNHRDLSGLSMMEQAVTTV